MLRVTVFKHDEDFLLVYAPDVAIVEIPDLEPPFTKESVQRAFAQEGIEVRVTVDVIGRELRELLRIRRSEERSERNQKFRLEEAKQAAEARGSLDPTLQEKGAILLRKQEIDEELRQVKLKIRATQDKVASHGYMPRAQYQQLLRREETLKQDSQACQVRLSELRKTNRERLPPPSGSKKLKRETYNARLLFHLGRIMRETYGREVEEKQFQRAKEYVNAEAETLESPP